MYCCYDQDLSKEKIIAFHDEYEVVKKYCDAIKKCHNKELKIGKIKKKILKNISDFDDLYLVRYGGTYIQSGYLEYMDIERGPYIYDNRYCKDILLRILELYDLSNSEIKNVKKTIKLIDKIMKNDSDYTPLISELEEMKMEYEPYIYNRSIIEMNDESKFDNEIKKIKETLSHSEKNI